MKKIIIILILAGFFFSCSVEGSLNLDRQGAGSLEMGFSLVPFFGEFFFDLVDEEILLDDTAKGLEANKGITSHTIEREEFNYTGKITFDQFERVLADDSVEEEQTIFTMTHNGDQTTLNIHFTRDNWDQMSVLVPIFSDPTIAMLGPNGSIGLTEEEYREMVIYPFEGYADSIEEAAKSLDVSELVFTVNVPNQVISQSGGRIKEKSVTFRIPLIRMLMLDQELSYSLTYK